MHDQMLQLDRYATFVIFNTNAMDIPKRFKSSIFGFGNRSRNCPGISLTKKEVIFALSILIYKYRFAGRCLLLIVTNLLH